jgi:glycosyltransferase involved in cell wall biosynthesis
VHDALVAWADARLTPLAAIMLLARHAALPARRCVAPLRHRGARGAGAVSAASATAARRCACSAAPPAGALAALPAGTSVLFLSPVWPEWRSSAAGAPRHSRHHGFYTCQRVLPTTDARAALCRCAAPGVRTAALIRAFTSWGWRVTYASTSDGAKNAFAAELDAAGVTTRTVPSNRGPALEALLAEAAPDVVVFDRFTTEEMFSFRVRELAPRALRIVDTQDVHSLRRARGALVAAGAPPAAVLAARPDANDADTLRELSAIHRSDLALICSPEEYRRLTRTYGIPARKLALASFFVPPMTPDAPGALPSFEARRDVAWIGNFLHPPNADAAAWLAGAVWDALKPRLPPGTECHIYGAYPTAKAAQLNAPKRGVRMLGYAPSVRVLSKYRLLAAPLRYGAGIKGKLLDGWECGTPAVTTPIGAEGTHPGDDEPWRCDYAFSPDGAPAGDWAGLVCDAARVTAHAAAAARPWGGEWRCEDAESFAAAAAALYADEAAWLDAQAAGFSALQALFPEAPALGAVRAALCRAASSKEEARASDFVSGMLWHHGARSTEFFSRFIEAKEGAAAAAAQAALAAAAAQAAAVARGHGDS